MKRVGYLYEKICDMDNLRLAHQNARRGKTWYSEVKMVDENIDYYLAELQKMLLNQTYHTSEYTIFEIKDGEKIRQIYKLPYYPDRICQWAILQIIEPYLLKRFTDDTYSAIPNKGIHYGANKVKHQLAHDNENCQYCLKLDVKKYYPSIDREILKAQYRRIFKDKKLLWLIDEIIDSPKVGTGVPIGNYLSQYSGNLYLSWFDHWIKEEKQVKYYHRYMDDVVIFGKDKQELRELFQEIKKYLSDNLHLQVKSNWQIFPTYKRGVDFLGYRFFGDHTILRKKTIIQIRKKSRKVLAKIENGERLTLHDYQSIQSYKGWVKYCDGYHVEQKYILPIINEYKKKHKTQNSLQNIESDLFSGGDIGDKESDTK